ncbi:MAG: (deoxy)nucleoside triphosphate pyrophosphohydrolase [Sphingomonas sp.]|uniref:(deoxy)nucleoside triphosphate pyrophosphohydrolase n=1 Tax=Sphingomonas sp. TaxID=28214 RepID=UPI001ACFA37E|nr:(deoxy)nucleoside triphosphate pyrophosphohydrolase [Sphingomonas sp.]MBN8807635.1 (deoxy)nucleoside triphosphate pyrophosphohydrolase [Sphingomonas sp.]
MSLLIVVAAALIDNAGRVLVAQRPVDKQHGGLWEFPGGKVEPGETATAALARELAEELGIAIGAVEPVAFAESAGERPMVLLLYRCTEWRGEAVAIEAAAITWAAIDELDALPMPPLDRQLLAALALAESGR